MQGTLVSNVQLATKSYSIIKERLIKPYDDM